jgi:hypothetical protein
MIETDPLYDALTKVPELQPAATVPLPTPAEAAVTVEPVGVLTLLFWTVMPVVTA